MTRPYRDNEEKQVRVVIERLSAAASELIAGYPEEAVGIIPQAQQACEVLMDMIDSFDKGEDDE